MSDRDDWLDDYIIMEMMEEDERNTPSRGSGGGSPGCGCLPGLLVVLVVFVLIILFTR